FAVGVALHTLPLEERRDLAIEEDGRGGRVVRVGRTRQQRPYQHEAESHRCEGALHTLRERLGRKPRELWHGSRGNGCAAIRAMTPQRIAGVCIWIVVSPLAAGAQQGETSSTASAAAATTVIEQ